MKQKAKKPVRLSPNFLDLIFIRDPKKNWDKNDRGAAVIDMPHRGFYAKIAQKFFHKPAVSHIALDRYGSVVWESLDGSNTVGDVVRIMEETFPDEKERMLDRTIAFLNTLRNHHFIIKA